MIFYTVDDRLKGHLVSTNILYLQEFCFQSISKITILRFRSEVNIT